MKPILFLLLITLTFACSGKSINKNSKTIFVKTIADECNYVGRIETQSSSSKNRAENFDRAKEDLILKAEQNGVNSMLIVNINLAGPSVSIETYGYFCPLSIQVRLKEDSSTLMTSDGL